MIFKSPYKTEIGLWVQARLTEQLAPELVSNIEAIEVSRDERAYIDRVSVVRKGTKDRMMIHSRVFNADAEIRPGTTFILTDQEKALLILFLQ